MRILTKKLSAIAIVIGIVLVMAVIAGTQRARHSSQDAEPVKEAEKPKTVVLRKRNTTAERKTLREHWEVKDDAELTEDAKDILHTFEYGTQDEITDAVGRVITMDNAQRIKLAKAGLDVIDNPDLRRDLVVSVSSLGTKKVLPVINQALRDSDPFVREQALNAVAQFANFRDQELTDWVAENRTKKESTQEDDTQEDDTEELTEEEFEEALEELEEYVTEEEWDELTLGLKEAFCDEDPVVRKDAMDTLRELTDDIRYRAMYAALQSNYEEVQTETVQLAGDERTKEGFEILLEGLDSENETTRTEAQDYIRDLTEEEFTSSSSAKSWWAEHGDDYDEDMVQSQKSLEERE